MTLVARPASQGLWFDCSAKPPIAWARARKAEGYVGVIRYLPLPGNSAIHDIDADELMMLTQDVGFEVMLVQHPRNPGWDPTLHDGYTDGHLAGWMALRAGYPDGAHIFCDYEGPVEGTTSATSKAFIEGHARAVAEQFTLGTRVASYKAGLYCGFDDPMTPEQLYLLHGVTCYWSDVGHRRVALRGVAMEQKPQVTVDGIALDPDDLHGDLLGQVPWSASWQSEAA